MTQAEIVDRLKSAEQPLSEKDAILWKPALEVRELLRRNVPFYSKKEVAEKIGCTVKTIERYMRDGMLTFFRRGVSGGVLIPETAIADFLRKEEINTLLSEETTSKSASKKMS